MSRRGALFRRLAAVTEKILIKPTDHGSISVTFARAIVSLIQFWQSQVEKGYSPFRHGILSLDLQFKDIDDSLSELAKLCHCVSISPYSAHVVPSNTTCPSRTFASHRRRTAIKIKRNGSKVRLPYILPNSSNGTIPPPEHLNSLP